MVVYTMVRHNFKGAAPCLYSIIMFHPDAQRVSDGQPDALAHNIYIIVYAVKLIDAGFQNGFR